ncbi:MAG TPA: hypothetical protein VHA13_04405, partial [Gammaproteobacteria bacterium]|nr:hypothetical protein [Gammaproteobacteria bacterium]
TKWQALIEEQEKSGLSQSEFCRQRDIVLSQFSYYRGLLKANNRVQSRKQELFSSVQLKKLETKSDEIKIVLPNGFQCHVPASIDTTQIKKLMETLLSC